MKPNSLTKKYMVAVALFGVVCFAYALINVPVAKIDLYLLILVLLTVGIGSQISIQIPRFKSHISVSDSFIFLALLLYGGEIAVILASIDAIFASWRFCKQKITVFLNFGVMALSTAVVAVVMHFTGLLAEVENHGTANDWDTFLIALSVMAIVQFVANTSIATVYGAMSSEQSFWETWKTKYLWSFVTYVVGAACAGFLFAMVQFVGFGVVIAAFPIVYLVYLSYKMYLRNVEMSISQAEQAEKYAKILEERSDALRDSEERFRSAFDFAPIGIGLVSHTGKWLKVNRALCDILGYTEEEFLKTDFQSLLVPEDLGDTLVNVHELISGQKLTCQSEQRYIHKEGNTVWVLWSVSPINTGTNPNLVFQIQDITDKKRADEKLQYEATHDSLTGLPNRAYFMSRLEKALEKADDNPSYRVSVLFIDLDRFKIVNDSLGHIVGDQLLVRIAGRLKECLRPEDIVARLGGDEFIILVEGKYEEEEIINIAERIQEEFANPFDLNGQEVYSSASIGVLQSTEVHKTAEDMMRDADTAMYQAKRAGKARHEVFDPNMHELVKETLRLETDLRRAVENDEFSVYYQPIYSLTSDRIDGFEALARWTHQSRGEIPPSKFIPLAEEIGLIDSLGEQILRKACRQMRSIQLASDDDTEIILNVNLSCKQFAHPQMVKNIRKILVDTGFKPQNLKLEITESVFFEHKERAITMLKDLRQAGIEINIDDFGTGYSNLSYLTQLPISTLKIDRTFIHSIEHDGTNVEIVQTIVALARSLGMRVIAEGVETEKQLNALRKLKCEGAQGFFFAKPMPFAEVEKFIREKAAILPHDYDGVPLTSLVQ